MSPNFAADHIFRYIAQSVRSPTVDPGVVSTFPAQSHNLVDIDCQIIFYSLHPLIQEGMLPFTSEVKLARKKVWLSKLTIST